MNRDGRLKEMIKIYKLKGGKIEEEMIERTDKDI